MKDRSPVRFFVPCLVAVLTFWSAASARAQAVDFHGQAFEEFPWSTTLAGANLQDAALGLVDILVPASGLAGADLDGVQTSAGTIAGGDWAWQGAVARYALIQNTSLVAGQGGFAAVDFTGTAFLGCRITAGPGAWQGTVLSGAVFRCCDLSAAGDLTLATFTLPPCYDSHSRLPAGFDPAAAGWKLLTPSTTELEIVSLRGEAAAGLPGLTHLAYNRTAIGEPGRVAFLGRLTGAGVTTANETTLWRELPGAGPALVAREGSPLPEDPGAVFSLFRNIWFQKDGAVTFETTVAGPAVTAENDRAFYHRTADIAGLPEPDALRLLVRDGAPFAPLPGAVVKTWGTPAVNPWTVALQGTFATGQGGIVAGTDTFLAWRRFRHAAALDVSENWAFLARESELVNLAPFPATATFSTLRPHIQLDGGRLVFSAAIRGVPAPGNTGVFSLETGAGLLSLVARGGDAISAPGAPALLRDSLYEDVSAPWGVAWRATLRNADGTPAPADAAQALCRRPWDAAVEVVARTGTSLLPGGEVFATLSNPVLTPSGGLVYSASLGGPAVTPDNDLSVWSAPASGAAQLLLREGGAAPGIPDATIATLKSVAVGPFGDLAVLASLVVNGTTVTAANDLVLWVGDGTPAGWLPALRQGDVIGLPGGLSKTIANLTLSGVNPAGLSAPAAPCVNALGEVSCIATWSGGSGVFVTRAARVLTTPPPLVTDTDGDGIPDAWETAHGLNPNDSTDAADDTDGDGLTHLQEYQSGTDPARFDTDGDGLSDGAEVMFGSDPATAEVTGTPLPETGLLLYTPQ